MATDSGAYYPERCSLRVGDVTVTKRLTGAMGNMRASGEVGIIPFITAGYPSAEATIELALALESAGVVALELGVPYSDALADGPTIQIASQKSIASGMTIRGCLDLVGKMRRVGISIPIVMMGYVNPILSYGVSEYARACAEAGADALIVPDLPPEESAELAEALASNGLTLIPLLAPTSTPDRIQSATIGAKGFIYCVSVAGVTGARQDLSLGLPDFIGSVRLSTSLPVAVGFGVSERRHIDAIGSYADAAVIGSALINAVGEVEDRQVGTVAAEFIRPLVGVKVTPASGVGDSR